MKQNQPIPEHEHFNDGVFRGIESSNPCKRCILEQAAPDLLEAAEALLINAIDLGECFTDDGDDVMYDDWQALSDAIDKARAE